MWFAIYVCGLSGPAWVYCILANSIINGCLQIYSNPVKWCYNNKLPVLSIHYIWLNQRILRHYAMRKNRPQNRPQGIIEEIRSKSFTKSWLFNALAMEEIIVESQPFHQQIIFTISLPITNPTHIEYLRNSKTPNI